MRSVNDIRDLHMTQMGGSLEGQGLGTGSAQGLEGKSYRQRGWEIRVEGGGEGGKMGQPPRVARPGRKEDLGCRCGCWPWCWSTDKGCCTAFARGLALTDSRLTLRAPLGPTCAREAHFEIYFGRGIDFLGGLFEAAEKMGIITRAGATYRCSLAPGEKLAVVSVDERAGGMVSSRTRVYCACIVRS